jgi:hypothetical protein
LPGFILSEHVDELTFDFTPYGPEGKIIEPTAGQIQNFRSALAGLFQELIPEDEGQPANPVELAKRVTEYVSRDQTEILYKILHAVAAVCSDSPSFDVLEGLPYRHQQAFVGWISGVFLLPPVPTPATSG